MRNLGIYGGTFAPVHNGHIYAARQFLSAYPLDRLLIIPTRQPPHKRLSNNDDPHHRLNMLYLAFPEAKREDSRLQISDFEILSPNPSYTALTLSHFSEPGTRLHFFLGTDMFLSMDSWYRPDLIFSLATIVHIPRLSLTRQDQEQIAAADSHYRDAYSAEIRHLSLPPHPLSSTEVREAIKNGLSTADMLPPAVAAYIEEHRLYRKELS